MDSDRRHAQVVEDFSEYVNPYLGKLMNFAGFGVEDHAEGCFVYDHEGRAFLDFLGGYGVFSLGHRHPKVVAAVEDQVRKMPLGSKVFFNEPMTLLAKKLAQMTPEPLQYTFFSNSGAEAVEAAIKLAKGATGRPKIVATEGGYHGKTLGALSITGRKKYQEPFYPLMPGADFVPFGDAEALERAIDGTTAAFIVEVVQGEGGIHVAPSGYLRRARELCDQYGALLITDEVQTGLGRTGTMFAFEQEGIVPDLLTLAKCLGGGVMPIGATMGTPAVWEATFGRNSLIHTSTFGGNPLACAAGLAALQVVEEENLCQKAKDRGDYLVASLRRVGEMYPDFVAEIRGRGLMVGAEFTMDEVGELVIAQLTKRGLIAAYTLNNPRVIRFEPPLIVSEAEIDQAVAAFDEALAETSKMLAELAV